MNCPNHINSMAKLVEESSRPKKFSPARHSAGTWFQGVWWDVDPFGPAGTDSALCWAVDRLRDMLVLVFILLLKRWSRQQARSPKSRTMSDATKAAVYGFMQLESNIGWAANSAVDPILQLPKPKFSFKMAFLSSFQHELTLFQNYFSRRAQHVTKKRGCRDFMTPLAFSELRGHFSVPASFFWPSCFFWHEKVSGNSQAF